MIARYFVLVLCAICLIHCARADDSDLFSFMPSHDAATVKHSSGHSVSGSQWGPGLNEKNVFHHQLRWGDKDKGWQMRIGKGGQIYSFVGPFGEAMPPQIHKGSEWNDEVWQLVSVSSAKNDATRVKIDGQNKQPLAYFIHGSGIYRRDPLLQKTFYNPILAEDTTRSSYAILNWGQHAHVPTIHKSSALYYTRINVLNDGGIELNYAIHNFGPDTLNYFNTPWGGVRETTLPVHILSKPDGSYAPTTFLPFNAKGIKNTNETGGWCGFFQDNTPESWGVVLVFGNSEEHQEKAKVRYRWGYAGARKNPRDYFVSVVNPRIAVEQGQTLRVKLYVFVDQLKNAGRRAAALKERVHYQTTAFARSPERTRTLEAENYSGILKSSAWPKKGEKPLFLVKHMETGKRYVTDDLYRFASRDDFKKYYLEYKGNAPVLRPYDGRTQYLKLLGFVDKNVRFD